MIVSFDNHQQLSPSCSSRRMSILIPISAVAYGLTRLQNSNTVASMHF